MAKDITLSQASQEYLNHLQELGKHPRTLYTYGKDFQQLVAFFGQDKPLSSILNIHIGKFLKSDELLKQSNGNPRAVQTVNKTIRVMRMFFIWALTVGYIDQLPLTKEIPLGRQGNEKKALA